MSQFDQLPAAEEFQPPSGEYHWGRQGNPDRDEATAVERIKMSNKSNDVMKAVLSEAEGIVCSDRNEIYGPPEINHGRTASLWTTYLGVPITPRQVCACMILQKLSRDANIRKHDNLVDIVGYAVNAAACEAAAGMDGT